MPDPRRFRPVVAALVAASLVGAPLHAMPDEAGEHLSAARQALIMGDAILAEAEAKAALGKGARRRDVAAVMGEALLYQGRIDRARTWLQSGDFATRDAAYGWRIAGRVEMAQGRMLAAAKAFDRALQINPRDAQLWTDIGRLRYAGGEQLLVDDALDRALASNPKHPRALEFRAQIARDTVGYAAAADFYRRALESAPADPGIALGLAATLGDSGQGKAMLDVLRDGQHRVAGSPSGHFYQAVLAARAGDIATARRVFNHAIGKLPATPAAQLFLGILELEAGNPSVASTSLDELTHRQPENGLAQLLFARSLYESGEHQRLIDTFEKVAARPDAPAYLLTLIARSYEEQGDREAAAPYLDRAAAVRPRAIMVLPAGDGSGAFAGSFATNPGSRTAAVGYVRGLLDSGNIAGARAAADRFRQTRPNMSEAAVLWGDAALVDRRYDQAFAAYDRAARVRLSEQLMARMTVALEGMGRRYQAQGVAARYLAAYPTSASAARIAAGYAAGAGDWPHAAALLEALLARGASRDVPLLADLSFARLQAGDAQAAVVAAESAFALQPANPQAVEALALALVALGTDDSRAAALLDRAQRTGGNSALLAKARATLAKRAPG